MNIEAIKKKIESRAPYGVKVICKDFKLSDSVGVCYEWMANGKLLRYAERFEKVDLDVASMIDFMNIGKKRKEMQLA